MYMCMYVCVYVCVYVYVCATYDMWAMWYIYMYMYIQEYPQGTRDKGRAGRRLDDFLKVQA